jgi:hypothetical protein
MEDTFLVDCARHLKGIIAHEAYRLEHWKGLLAAFEREIKERKAPDTDLPSAWKR